MCQRISSDFSPLKRRYQGLEYGDNPSWSAVIYHCGFWLWVLPYGVSSERDHHSESIRMTSRSCRGYSPPLPLGDFCMHTTLKGIRSYRVAGIWEADMSPSRGNRWNRMLGQGNQNKDNSDQEKKEMKQDREWTWVHLWRMLNFVCILYS